MKILAIDSSGLVASVSYVADGSIVAEYTINYKKTHSQTLLPMIDEIKSMADIELSEIEAIAVANGPGSFTGLRIGSATAKGLAMALNIPVIEVSTIEALAYNAYGMDALVCPIMDARRDQVYTGIYEFLKIGDKEYKYESNCILEPVAMSITELAEKINVLGKDVLFTGDGCEVYKDKVAELLKVKYTYAPFTMSRQKAGCVALAAEKYFLAGKFVSASDSSPVYLRATQAERERAEKLAGGSC